MRCSDGLASCGGSSSDRRYAFAVGSNYSDDEILDGGVRTGVIGGAPVTPSVAFGNASCGSAAWRPVQQLRRRKSEDYGRCSVERPFGFAVELNGCSGSSSSAAANRYQLDDEVVDHEVETLFSAPRNGYVDQRGCWRKVPEGDYSIVVSGGQHSCAAVHCGAVPAARRHAAFTSGSSTSTHCCVLRDHAAVSYGNATAASSNERTACYGRSPMASHSSTCSCAQPRSDRMSGCAGMVADRPPLASVYRQQFIERFSSMSHGDNENSKDDDDNGRTTSKKNGGTSVCVMSEAADVQRQLELFYNDAGYRDRRSIALQSPSTTYVVRASNAETRRRPSAEPEVLLSRRGGCTAVGERSLPSSVVYFYERASICDPFPLPAVVSSSSNAVNQSLSATNSKIGNRKYRGGNNSSDKVVHNSATLPNEHDVEKSTSSSSFMGALRRVNSLVSGGSSTSNQEQLRGDTADVDATGRRRHQHNGGYRRYPSGCGAAADEGFGDDGRVIGPTSRATSSPSETAIVNDPHRTSQTSSGHVCCRCGDVSASAVPGHLAVVNQCASSSSSTSSIASSSSATAASSAATGNRPVTTVGSGVPPSTDRNRKRSYRVGLNLFNKNPEQGITYLRERLFLDQRPSSTAKFLIARKGLSKQMIGEYLGGSPTPFLSQVLRSFAQQIDVSNSEIDVALRKFQTFFRMPGEAQKIERIIEVFATQYCLCNPEIAEQFASTDTIFLLSFAVMMLNTDLHNRNVRHDKKMKLEDFIRNLRGVDAGSDVDPVLLTAIYERIKAAEFAPGEDHVTQVVRVEQMLIGKKPPLSTVFYRRLVCYCRLQEVTDPGRRQRSTQHQREVFLFNDILLVAKVVGRQKNSLSYSYRQSFSLTSMGVYLFEGAYYRYGVCLTNTTDNKVLIMLIARNEHDRRNFVEDLKEAILENAELRSVELEQSRLASLAKASSSSLIVDQVKQSSNVNRYSNDSGVVDVDLVRPPSEIAASAEIHRAPVGVGSRSRPHSIHSGSDHGSAASLDSGQSQGQTAGCAGVQARRIN